MQNNIMDCVNCELNKEIVNKHFKLCLECNNLRLYGNKYGKRYKIKQKPINFIKTTKKLKNFNSNKKNKANKKSLFAPKTNEEEKLNRIELDEIFYEECFNDSNHKCEECNKDLPTEFRDGEGNVIARFRYSHIIQKSIAPQLRRVRKNINHLCLSCHSRWEFGDKKNMKIYESNKLLFPNYL